MQAQQKVVTITEDGTPEVATVTGTVKAGLGQITNPTPQFAKNIFRIVLYAAVIVNIVILNVPTIPDHYKVQILAYAGMATGLVHAISKLFGIDITDIQPPATSTNVVS